MYHLYFVAAETSSTFSPAEQGSHASVEDRVKIWESLRERDHTLPAAAAAQTLMDPNPHTQTTHKKNMKTELWT